jgi:hypothetical protein
MVLCVIYLSFRQRRCIGVSCLSAFRRRIFHLSVEVYIFKTLVNQPARLVLIIQMTTKAPFSFKVNLNALYVLLSQIHMSDI